MQLMNARRQTLGQARNDWRVITTRSNNHLIGRKLALGGMHLETTDGARHHALYCHALAHRRIHRFNEARQVRVDLVFFHEPVRIGALEIIDVGVTR
ncbi:hypothetical protein D3C84_1121720 [compost metagenome]